MNIIKYWLDVYCCRCSFDMNSVVILNHSSINQVVCLSVHSTHSWLIAIIFRQEQCAVKFSSATEVQSYGNRTGNYSTVFNFRNMLSICPSKGLKMVVFTMQWQSTIASSSSMWICFISQFMRSIDNIRKLHPTHTMTIIIVTTLKLDVDYYDYHFIESTKAKWSICHFSKHTETNARCLSSAHARQNHFIR